MISSINTRKGALACPGPASPPIKLRFRNSISRKKDISHVVRSTETPDQISYEDPEKKFRRYGPNFGSQHQINEPLHWLKDMPRMWMRSKEHRKHDELIELIVLNERLSGNMPAWEARQRLEYLKLRRKNWEAIYDYITRTDAAATLALVEEANSKVEEALMDDVQEQTGVGALQTKLLELQGEVNEARVKLQVSQGRLDQNLQRVNELKAEAAALERIRLSSPSADSAAVQLMPEEASASSQKARRAAGPRSSERRGNKSLQSSLEIEDGLRNFWYPAEFSKKLQPNTLVPFEMFNKSWVLFRDNNGQPACLRDSCAHRACPLSLGKVKDGQVQCAYHGWEFNAEGTCTKMPSVAGVCKDVGVAAMPCAEKDGFVWVWPGAGAPTMDVPDFAAPPAGFSIHAEVMVEVPVEHGLLMENLLDLAHAPFTHTSTFAKGWPVPEVVRFHTTKMLSGNWDPYPISMAFQPPCMVLSTIGLSQPGKIERGLTADQCKRHLHQLHVCMPSKTGHTRLLYRMSMDFWQWAQNLPFLERVWKKVAEQVLAEDYVLVKGQQDRMAEGENTWNCPMAYDKLAVRYRRWRNSVAAGEYADGARIAAGANMSAGQMFFEAEESYDAEECDFRP